MNWNRRKTIFLIISILWMGVMWGFSAENDVKSSGRSLEIAKSFCSTFVKNYKGLSIQKQEDIAGTITFPIRKAAHAMEYGILALLVAGWNADYRSRTVELKRKLWISFGITVAYASVDEIHQLFVPGRAGMVRDVLIDSLGAFAGLMILYMIIKRRNNECVTDTPT